jgi:hypothetical protein
MGSPLPSPIHTRRRPSKSKVLVEPPMDCLRLQISISMAVIALLRLYLRRIAIFWQGGRPILLLTTKCKRGQVRATRGRAGSLSDSVDRAELSVCSSGADQLTGWRPHLWSAVAKFLDASHFLASSRVVHSKLSYDFSRLI